MWSSQRSVNWPSVSAASACFLVLNPALHCRRRVPSGPGGTLSTQYHSRHREEQRCSAFLCPWVHLEMTEPLMVSALVAGRGLVSGGAVMAAVPGLGVVAGPEICQPSP